MKDANRRTRLPFGCSMAPPLSTGAEPRRIMPRCVLASERMQTTHYVALALAVLAGGAPAQAAAVHDYPTVDRVEFVLECMQKNAGKQEFLYKCASVIDEIAKQYTYDDFVEAPTLPPFHA